MNAYSSPVRNLILRQTLGLAGLTGAALLLGGCIVDGPPRARMERPQREVRVVQEAPPPPPPNVIYTTPGVPPPPPPPQVVVVQAPPPPRMQAIIVEQAPPPPRREIIVAQPSPRHIGIAGYWRHDGRAFVWVPGRWELPPRGGAVWVEPRWERRGNGFVMIEGTWR